jgi:hypothetical protein
MLREFLAGGYVDAAAREALRTQLSEDTTAALLLIHPWDAALEPAGWQNWLASVIGRLEQRGQP